MKRAMKTTCNLVRVLLLVLCSFILVSCDKDDDTDLIAPAYKNLNISCGSDFEIPILSNNWSIESVQDKTSNEVLLDKDGNSLSLIGDGKVEAANGWLTLTHDSNDKFIIGLKENFDKSNERKFMICINNAGQRDYINVVQQAGTAYKLVKAIYKEVEGERKIYVSDDECQSLTLSNNTSEAVWKPTGYIFENVIESSCFQSNDYGAFSWIPEEGLEVNTSELLIDGYIRWSGNCTYKEGISTTPFIKNILNGSKILVQPHSTLYLTGEITYCKRICNYTFTIENVKTGTQFEISGIWTQIVPISSNTISSDK